MCFVAQLTEKHHSLNECQESKVKLKFIFKYWINFLQWTQHMFSYFISPRHLPLYEHILNITIIIFKSVLPDLT